MNLWSDKVKLFLFTYAKIVNASSHSTELTQIELAQSYPCSTKTAMLTGHMLHLAVADAVMEASLRKANIWSLTSELHCECIGLDRLDWARTAVGKERE